MDVTVISSTLRGPASQGGRSTGNICSKGFCQAPNQPFKRPRPRCIGVRASAEERDKAFKALSDVLKVLNSRMGEDEAVLRRLKKKANEFKEKAKKDSRMHEEEGKALREEVKSTSSAFEEKWREGSIAEGVTQMKQYLKRRLVWERIMKRLTLSPGLTGTVAVLVGRHLHLDPFGNFHWDGHDAALGIAFMLPLLLLDAAMMLPDFYGLSERTVQDLSAKPLSPVDKETLPFVPSLLPYVSQAGAEERSLPQTVDGSGQASTSGRDAAAAALAAAAAVASQSSRRTAWMRLEGSIKNGQRLLLRRGTATGATPLAVDTGLLLLSQLGTVMLEYGLIFAGLAKWETDRLYEAGLQDTVRVLGQDMSLQSFAAFSALGTMSAGLLIFTIAVFAKDVQVHGKKARLLHKQLDEKTRKVMDYRLFRQMLKESGAEDPAQVAQQLQKSLVASGTLHAAMRERADWKSKDRAAQDAWNVALISLQRILGMWGCGASFVVTGNLLAPFCASVATDALRTAYSRVQAPKLRRKQNALVDKLKVTMAAEKERLEQQRTSGEASERSR